MLVGFHIQNSPNNYLDAVRELAPGSLVKYTSGWERAIEAKAHNPGVKTWARHVVEQPMPTGNYEQTARNYFQGMVDVNAEHWKFMDYIQGWNEFYAESQHWDEKQHWVATDIAFAKVWAEEYRPRFPNIRFVMSEAPIGNSIPWQVAEASLEYDALLGYHGYTPMLYKQDHPVGQWPDYAGRWETMDNVFRSKGLLVDWIEGEMGPYQSAITGWRHKFVLDRDMDAYKQHLLDWINHVRRTLAYQQGRFYGGVLFTCGAPGGGPNWSYFDHNAEEMKEIAIFVREVMDDGVPNPPIQPPEPPTEPPVYPPPLDGLLNGSFENGWSDQSTTAQEPHGWVLNVHDKGDVRGRPINGTPECVHKLASQLPPDEQPGGENALILDGETCYKMHSHGATWRASFWQMASGLEPYQDVVLTVPVNIHFDGRGDTYDEEDTMLRVINNGIVATLWMTKERSRQWQYIKINAAADEDGDVIIEIEASVKWEHPTSFFFDAITLEVEDTPMPSCDGLPRVEYARRMLVVPQDATMTEWLSVCQEAFANRESVGFSYDDAGIGKLEDKTAILYDLDEDQKEEYGEWFDYHYPCTGVVFRDYPTPFEPGVVIDVSHWQGRMDWGKARESGVTHAFIKATQGIDFKDPEFDRNWAEAKAHGILRGAFHYYENRYSPDSQAAWFLEVVGSDTGELPLILDVEDREDTSSSDAILEWLQVVEDETEHEVAIYTSAAYWDEFFPERLEWPKEYKLWVAHWTDAYAPDIPEDWNDWWLWQYTNTANGYSYGASSPHIDLDRFA